MAAIVIPLPRRYHYSTQTDIRITDINYAGHLGNDQVLSRCGRWLSDTGGLL